MCNLKSYRGAALGAAVAAAMGLGASAANAAESLWISAPTWSYSAALASSPRGTAYFWGLSVGANTFSFAYAFSNDGAGDAAYAFAEASAGGLGGYGAVDAAGFADPYAGLGIDITPLDPSNTGSYPSTKPGTDPLTSPYSVSTSGITFTSEGSSELNGSDGIQAFTYNNSSSASYSSLESALGASNNGGNTSTGDVTGISTLTTDLGLIPLDPLITDPSSLTTLTFTENNSSVNPSNVILVGVQDAAAPEPAPLAMLALAGAGLLLKRGKKLEVRS